MAESFERERRRCVDRLRTMPMSKLEASAALAYDTCLALKALTPEAADFSLPRLADHAAGDQLDVMSDEYLASNPDATSLETAAVILTRLRQALPR